ncbi:MAG: 16S rRNA (cytosine(1402)-N(4))-methyltransferase RsmH [Chloroflexota bacterium]|nr:16S rRNA (cytosine(1402)-N(4))-methyltransferase RsmH [Chloroflexota bacterium]
MIHHKPVMVDEVVSALQPRSDGRYIDCTNGEGGHAEAILGHCDPPARLLGLDLDREALAAAEARLAGFRETTTLVETSYVNIAEVAAEHDFLPCDGVLFDLGVSSLQLDNTSRGFAFSKEAALDMRFGPSIGRSAKEIVNDTDEESLANLIYRLGEERRSRRIARAIVRARPVETTVELADVVAGAIGRRSRGRRSIHPATRTFQALRIAVNGELDNVEAGIRAAIGTLRQGGRLVVISYHSLEDRLVKNLLREESKPVDENRSPALRLITKRVRKPETSEIEANPRSRSARMRAAERL